MTVLARECTGQIAASLIRCAQVETVQALCRHMATGVQRFLLDPAVRLLFCAAGGLRDTPRCVLRSRIQGACELLLLLRKGARFAVLLLILAAGELKGSGMGNWLADAWHVEEGLPENTVNAIVQTPDGYLWLATFNGLARFDGIRFVVFDAANTPQLKSSRIHQLHLDSRGGLWIISEFGHLARMANGRFTEFGEQNGIAGKVGTLHEDGKGLLWADLSRELRWFDGKRFVEGRNTNYINIDAWPKQAGEPAGHSFRGTNWNPNGATFRPGDRARLNIGKGPSIEYRNLSARDGGIWVVNHRAQKFREGRWERVIDAPEPLKKVSALCEDQRGDLWVGTWDDGVFCFGADGRVRPLRLTESTIHWPVRALFEDREGNLWIGSGGDGLRRLRPRAMTVYDHGTGLRSDVVRSIAEDDSGKIWVCGLGGIDWIAPGTPAAATASPFGMAIPWGMLADRRGAMWIATYQTGLFRHQDGELVQLTGDPAGRALSSEINVLYEDRAGQLHVGTPQGLYRVEGNRLKLADCQNLPSMDVRAIAEDKADHLYIGLNGGGLLRRAEGRWTELSCADGLSEAHVWSLYVDDEDTVWVGTVGKGLSRFRDGKFFNFTAPHVPLPRLITCILEDDDGRLWLGSHQGIFRVARSELNAFADGRSRSITAVRYGKSDGMGSSECVGGRQPSACKTRDGRLWFATVKGACVVDPKNIPFNPQPPPVVIEEVVADGKNVAREAGSGPMIPAGGARLEIHYAGLSFVAPERVRFKYKLEGFDTDWLEAGGSRIAHYTRVPPGSYTFKAKASNNDGVWNETGAELAMTVLPSWWQTSWFRSGVFLALGLTVASAYRWRVQGLKRERLAQETFSRRLLESQENERQRIAAELHDSLGQSLLVVKNYAAMALKDGNTPEKVRAQLHEISESASASIDEVRSIARALRPYQLDRFGLTKTLEDAAELIAKTGSLQITTSIDNVDDMFSADAQISIYRVVQEWLNNVVKHAQAATARLSVRKDSQWIRIILEDDGVGFDYSAVMSQAGGKPTFGLTNLRERIHLLGGILKIDSPPGKGTRLCVEIPCRK